jgi:hypothetical protein
MFEMKAGRRCVGAALWTAFGVELAAAQTFHVKEADFDKGEWSVESINASQHGFPVNADRIRTGHEPGLGYGISAFWQLKGLISFHSPVDESIRLQRGLIENIFVVRALPEGRNRIAAAPLWNSRNTAWGPCSSLRLN